MTVVKELDNKLLKRKEVELVEVSNEGNIGYEKSKKLIAEKFKASEDLIIIKEVYSRFGSNEFIIDAYIYGDAESMKAVEPRNKNEAGASS